MQSIDEVNVGIAQTVALVQEAMPAAMAAAAARQAAAAEFIKSNGHQVIAGHAAVTQDQLGGGAA
jgi:hypothetical protein